MNLEEIHNKILKKEICRLCLDFSDKTMDIFGGTNEDSSSPEVLIRKFNIIEVENL